jgi:XRE family transcriptional regulator, regulator of sulfur utilization
LPVSETQVLRLLAERIKSLRHSKGWSQEQLSERASMQRSYLGDLERGFRNPSIRTLVKLANAFGVSIMALFEHDTKRKKL